jgi:hypothetical protein
MAGNPKSPYWTQNYVPVPNPSLLLTVTVNTDPLAGRWYLYGLYNPTGTYQLFGIYSSRRKATRAIRRAPAANIRWWYLLSWERPPLSGWYYQQTFLDPV